MGGSYGFAGHNGMDSMVIYEGSPIMASVYACVARETGKNSEPGMSSPSGILSGGLNAAVSQYIGTPRH